MSNVMKRFVQRKNRCRPARGTCVRSGLACLGAGGARDHCYAFMQTCIHDHQNNYFGQTSQSPSAGSSGSVINIPRILFHVPCVSTSLRLYASYGVHGCLLNTKHKTQHTKRVVQSIPVDAQSVIKYTDGRNGNRYKYRCITPKSQDGPSGSRRRRARP
jgi:hypothetical protein